MNILSLEKLVIRDKAFAATAEALIDALGGGACILDTKGGLLLGTPAPLHDSTLRRAPLLCDEHIIGYVAGAGSIELIARTLNTIIEREFQKKLLAREVLEKYREINLLYTIADKVSALLQVEQVARIAVDEAQAIIHADVQALLLYNELDGFTPAVLLNSDAGRAGADVLRALPMTSGLIARITASGEAELVNDVSRDLRASANERTLRAIVCAPLKAKQEVIGVLVLASVSETQYTAADLKLLHAIAVQITPAIEAAAVHEQALREAGEREERLQQRLAQMQDMIDQTHQTEQVAEITSSDYFRKLRAEANMLRKKLE